MNSIILKTIEDVNDWRLTHRKNINFIPTMGNLHEGHKKLIEESKKSINHLSLVSIFINPLQFDKKEDLKNYPKTINQDIKASFSAGADAIFIPSTEEIFPNDSSQIEFQKADIKLSRNLCGIYRKGHFDGVCTVIYRLLKIIKPHTLFLGEKDWQQLLIIKKLILTKKLNINIKSIDTQRNSDGVPFSSRNNLLVGEEKDKIKFFSQQLINIRHIFHESLFINLDQIKRNLIKNNIQIEYLEHLNAFNFERSISETNITILAGAIICGDTRLIDHVFLMRKKPIIAIDGPAGSGKSTVTKLIAKNLDFLYLDTGAMYRALSWLLINEKINYQNTEELEDILKNISITFKTNSKSEQDVVINNYCVTEKIRSPKINSIVSSIASIKEIREFLVKEQRKIGNKGGLIAEGRDIGSTVFPNAELKIYLTASIDERARRRKIELEKKDYGIIDLEVLKNQIKERDYEDSTRKISPLIKAEDAIEILTDNKSVNEIAEKIIDIFKETIPKELQDAFR